MMAAVLSAISVLSFDFFSLPGVACIFKHMKYEEKLQICTTVPFVVILMLATPIFLIKMCSKIEGLFRCWENTSRQTKALQATPQTLFSFLC